MRVRSSTTPQAGRVMDGSSPAGATSRRATSWRRRSAGGWPRRPPGSTTTSTSTPPTWASGSTPRFPSITAACRENGIDPATERIPVAPAAHYACGGIRARLDGPTALPGLFAVGEVAATGVHGANRLASNSLTESVVGGTHLGRDLAWELPEPVEPHADLSVDEVRLVAPEQRKAGPRGDVEARRSAPRRRVAGRRTIDARRACATRSAPTWRRAATRGRRRTCSPWRWRSPPRPRHGPSRAAATGAPTSPSRVTSGSPTSTCVSAPAGCPSTACRPGA